MPKNHYDDLQSFIVVARERSFTRAAAKLGVTQSALSHMIRNLEARLGVRLLTRTTRTVAPTALGERLLETIAPRLDEIDRDLQEILELRDHPAGTLRITASDYAAQMILRPKLALFLHRYPDICIELDTDNANANIVSGQYDAGVRMGESVERDMIAVRIAPKLRFAVVATPDYFSKHAIPAHPRELTAHRCINMRLLTHGNPWLWEFDRGEGEIRVRVEGQVMFSSIFQVIDAAVDGLGVAYVPEELALQHIQDGRLVRVLEEWCPLWEGFHLYYPSRRQSSRAMRLLVDALRHDLPDMQTELR